jgi:hypothetical protein
VTLRASCSKPQRDRSGRVFFGGVGHRFEIQRKTPKSGIRVHGSELDDEIFRMRIRSVEGKVIESC